MRNKKFPMYPDDTDYNTNSPSYYDDLARKQKLMQLLTEKIWEYDDEIKEYFKRWEDNLETINEDVIEMMIQWSDDGTLDHIINDTIFNWKADKTYVDSEIERLDQKDEDLTTHVDNEFDSVHTQLEHVMNRTSGIVNVKEYGAIGDGVTDDTQSIQHAIDSIGQGNSMVTSNGQPVTLVFPNGVYKVSETIHLNKHDVHLKGLGNAVLMSDEYFNSKSLTGILALGTDGGSYHNNVIDNLTFTREKANPYNNYNGDFGQAEAYDFSRSNLGLLIDDAHYYTVSNCKFIGLKLGLWLKGAWAGEVESSKFHFNDRHLQSSPTTNRTVNHVRVRSCIFGSAILNGGIAIIDSNGLKFEFCNIEHSHHVAIFSKQSQYIKLNDCHFERNAKYSKHVNTPAHVYQSTIFSTGIDDGLPKDYDGFNLVDNASGQSYIIENCVLVMPSNNLVGYVKAINTKTSINFINTTFRMYGNKSIEYFVMAEGLSQPFLFENCAIDPIWKLTNKFGSTVKNSADFTIINAGYKDEFFVDLSNGNDYMYTLDNSEDRPIKDLQGLFNGLPKDNDGEFTVHIKGNTTTTMKLDLSLTHGGKINLIGEAVNSLNELVILYPINGYVVIDNLNINGGLHDYFYPAITGNHYGQGSLSIRNSTIKSNRKGGTINFDRTFGNKIISVMNSTVTQSGTSNNLIVVNNGTQLWVKGVTGNKTISVRDLGSCYYRDLTGINVELQSDSVGVMQQIVDS